MKLDREMPVDPNLSKIPDLDSGLKPAKITISVIYGFWKELFLTRFSKGSPNPICNVSHHPTSANLPAGEADTLSQTPT